VEGRECSKSGEIDFGEPDESKCKTYPLHWGCVCAGKWSVYTAA